MADVYEVNDNANDSTVDNAGSQEVPNSKLNPVTQTVIEKCIQEVVGKYVAQQKLFTADTIHYLRTKVTELVHERLGDSEVTSVDIGLNLTDLQDIPFFFKVNIPQEKVESHIMSDEANVAEDTSDIEEIDEEVTVEEISDSDDDQSLVEPADDVKTEECSQRGMIECLYMAGAHAQQ